MADRDQIQEQDSREVERQELLDQAADAPGVADVIEAYGALEKYRVVNTASAPKARFATGANG